MQTRLDMCYVLISFIPAFSTETSSLSGELDAILCTAKCVCIQYQLNCYCVLFSEPMSMSALLLIGLNLICCLV